MKTLYGRYHKHNYPFFGLRHHWGRRFLTKDERKELDAKRVKWLELYKESLEKELEGVNERLEELKKEKE